MRFLVIRFSSIGDIILTTPVFRLLKNQFPKAEIHWVTKCSFASVLEENPNIDKIWRWDDKDDRKLLKQESFDFVFDLQKNARSRQVKWMFFGTPISTITKQNFRKLIWVVLKQKNIRKWGWLAKFLECRTFTDRCIDVLKVYGIVDDEQGLDYNVSSDTEKMLISSFNLPQEFVCLSLGGSFFTKRMPANKWQKLMTDLNKDVVLIGGSSDLELSELLVVNLMNSKINFSVINLVGKLSLKESATVLNLSNQVYTGDTGMLHIAAALGRDLTLFWGNTIPEFGMKPPIKRESKFAEIEVEGLSCRPCSKLGFNECPKAHFNCMNNLQI